ncbi:Retrotransposon protein [Nesidiocoris tenuis]|uniref:Retrotransposon protein n=1 Tax=Nesidiocoris tenuis TaxID=355587 RepID=A0ABN7AXB4_9HEMI|nr:Retrotransposon protein [Nesidiocoris tenuis]
MEKHASTVPRPYNLRPRTTLLTQSVQNTLRSYSPSKIECFVCKQNHTLLNCLKFQNSPAQQRVALLKHWKGCYNCLSFKHVSEECHSRWTCRFCSQKHHSLLHLDKPENSAQPTGQPKPSTSVTMSTFSNRRSQILLGTVVLEIENSRGDFHSIRMVVDSGSQSTFLTQQCVRKLGLHVNKVPKPISCLGDVSFSGVEGTVLCKFRPIRGCQELISEALVVRKITTDLPNFTVSRQFWEPYTQYNLADPSFYEPRPIDGLLGCDVVPDIWTGEIVSMGLNKPKLFNSIFGHIIMGRITSTEPLPGASTVLFSAALTESSDSLRRFWELEEPSIARHSNPDDDICEEHFRATHSRDATGRYIISLPFKCTDPDFGPIQPLAIRCFQNLEAKLRRNPSTADQYRKFMAEYLSLGHMRETNVPSKYVIPHHCISKTDNPSKFRVVFNGSASTRHHSSLNDQLWPGPKLQADIKILLMNFRRHPVVFVADVVKMYRQILVNSAQRCYQHIYWRFSPDEKLQCYELMTLTYGLTNSPFLALRVMEQLKEDEGHHFPLAAQMLCTDRYIDDFVTGASTVELALELQAQLIGLLAKGGFSLSKWSSNRVELLQSVDSQETSTPVSLSPKDDCSVKILGLQWNPDLDIFSYNIGIPTGSVTKRSMLSTIAKIYDPLGFLSPVVFLAKCFVQDLWKANLDWDDPVPENLSEPWTNFVNQFPALLAIKIPRFAFETSTWAYHLIGFSDASTKGYSATIYIRTLSSERIQSTLLVAKSKLAPVKTISIPRLELCGAVLLCQLYGSMTEFLKRLPSPSKPPTFFTDSTIVLSWLNTPTYKLKTFVANRVALIQDETPTSTWAHVLSEDNPSDCNSRGLLPNQMIHHPLWWSGPSWLSEPISMWPSSDVQLISDPPELKSDVPLTALVGTSKATCDTSWMDRFSSFYRLVLFVGTLRRFIHNRRFPTSPQSGPLTALEFREAESSCVKAVQSTHYVTDLPSGQHNILQTFGKLSPFWDEKGILRVGGRLKNANLTFAQKHPILLPPKSHFSTLLVDYYHKIHLHPGPGLLQALIQLKFWIPSLRRLARHRVFMCLTCFRLRKASQKTAPTMGELPACRVNVGRAFQHTGVDFAGPLLIRDSLRRKAPQSKAYICVLVCMATKAVHLEAVSSLSTAAFLACFDRFLGRRGLPQRMYSDCGTNFQGASSHLKELEQWYQSEITRSRIIDFSTTKGVTWVFNPPHAPHFGGLWESTVKSVKRHLRAVAGNTPLTFEELSTLLVRIESLLNSRPLCPLSTSPEETDFLTPGHFLIGDHLRSTPEPTLLDLPINRLDRWQLVKRMAEQIWKRWRIEYLSQLQQRTKWTKDQPNLQEGDLVLLQEPQAPPLTWPTGRIIAVHPGADSIVRVATVKSGNSIFKRPVVKLIPLRPLNVPAYDSVNFSQI